MKNEKIVLSPKSESEPGTVSNAHVEPENK